MAGKDLTFSTVEPDAGIKAALGMGRSEIIRALETSGIRGRGGAGFPVSTKWNLAAAAKDTEKIVVCNADEGEPGTFKDRVILTDYANLVVEGMTIAARAIGAKKGIIYLRGEYAYLRSRIENALLRRREQNLLGEAILGTPGFDFEIKIRMGAGAYICGEETALIESLEGFRGEPRNRPPFPVDTGWFGHPTTVNNVETLAWCACILAKGADWFRGIGTDKSSGLKLFSVSGDCERPGVYEFPLGISIADFLREVAGEDAKAVQVGGASGHCVPREQFGRSLAFEDIPTGGSMIVIGPHRNMLQVAHNFLEFFVEESCGQCTPCREGNPILLDGVRRLENGAMTPQYLEELKALGETMRAASKCGLGQTSPNAFLSIIEHFQNEIMPAAPAGA
ncbi:MAG: NADH-quinone oxidoreductase subunit F [Candidatus Hydrogenedentota bacterium]